MLEITLSFSHEHLYRWEIESSQGKFIFVLFDHLQYQVHILAAVGWSALQCYEGNAASEHNTTKSGEGVLW